MSDYTVKQITQCWIRQALLYFFTGFPKSPEAGSWWSTCSGSLSMEPSVTVVTSSTESLYQYWLETRSMAISSNHLLMLNVYIQQMALKPEQPELSKGSSGVLSWKAVITHSFPRRRLQFPSFGCILYSLFWDWHFYIYKRLFI